MPEFRTTDPYLGQFWVAAALLISTRPPSFAPSASEDDKRKLVAEATAKMAVELIRVARTLEKWTVG